jgi:serine/threonine protein kinase
VQIESRHWSRLSQLLDEALDLPAEGRAAWLAEIELTDSSLAEPLRDLLARHAQLETSDFLEALPAIELLQSEAAPDPETGWIPGATIGPYELETELGRGGMGTVWRARRIDGALKRVVALKLPNASLFSTDWLERFTRERDILAALEHQHIARLYDAGSSSDGQPYLALELVAGIPIDTFCDRQCLGVRERLELFLQVLDAVQYAHANLVIHRDLKPSNILVTEKGSVRLLDFGIAKLLPTHSGHVTALTVVGTRAMTPDYSAPEQIMSGAITTATDVYSAGIVLCELLTGERPYRLHRHSLGELEEAIVEVDPVRPSRVAVSAERAGARNTTAERLRGQLAGDLDTIILKAIRKNPDDRYATIDAMQQDLRLHLANEPLLSRPDQAWYRIGKFVSRHKLPVALAAALLVAIVAGLGAALWGLSSARAQATRAEAAKGFLLKVFSTGNPSSTGGKNITASEILERGSKQIDAELRDQPALLGELHSEIADVYSSFGANEDSLLHAQKALRLLESTGARSTPEYFSALYRVANANMEEERWPEARAAFQRLRAAAAAQFGPTNRWEAMALEDMITIEDSNGHMTEAQAASRAALAMNEALYGQRSKQYLRVLGTSEQLYLDRGQPEEALKFIRRVIALAPSVPDYALADRLMDRYMLASTLYRLQQYEDSADELRRLVPEMETNMGVGNDRTGKARNTLALNLTQLGELTEALAIQRRNLDLLAQSRVGDQDVIVAQQATLTRILARLDRYKEAIPIQRHVVEYFDGRYPSPTLLRELFRCSLGDMLARSGEARKGIEHLEECIFNMNKIKDYQPDPLYAESLQSEGNGYRLLRRSAEADAAFSKACALYQSVLGEKSVATLRCRLYKLVAESANTDAAGVSALMPTFRSLRDNLLAQLPIHQALRAELLLVEAELELKIGAIADAGTHEQEGTRSYFDLVGVSPHLPLSGFH